MRNKRARFEDNKISHNVLEEGKDIYHKIKGNWNKIYFKNNNPIILELGCGTGRYTYSLASMFPNKNFIGVDIKGSRIWSGSQRSDRDNLFNVAFLRSRIEMINEFFDKNEIDEIIITFPDPRPKKGDAKKRLTSERFLNLYKNIIKPDGKVYLKTDSFELFEFTLYTLKSLKLKPLIFSSDFYNSNIHTYHKDIQTDYERRFLEQGLKIRYLCFSF